MILIGGCRGGAATGTTMTRKQSKRALVLLGFPLSISFHLEPGLGNGAAHSGLVFPLSLIWKHRGGVPSTNCQGISWPYLG